MKTWAIYLNGAHYSCWYSSLRSLKHRQTILALWKAHMMALGYTVPTGTLEARYCF
jgi:hypothetical protein